MVSHERMVRLQSSRCEICQVGFSFSWHILLFFPRSPRAPAPP